MASTSASFPTRRSCRSVADLARNGDGTRQELLSHAARLLAAGGAYQVTNREIIEAAGQRNASALSYHFGTRDDLILAILSTMGADLDGQRGALAEGLDSDSPTAALLHALVVPYSGCLQTEPGRHYVQIVDQLRSGFVGASDTSSTDPHLDRILAIVGARPVGLPAKVRRERLIAMVTLMTAMVAERARRLEAGRRAPTSHDQFVDNLVDMLVGLVEAPARTPAGSG